MGGIDDLPGVGEVQVDGVGAGERGQIRTLPGRGLVLTVRSVSGFG